MLLARPKVEVHEVCGDPLRRVHVATVGRAMVSSHWSGECWFALKLVNDLPTRLYPLPAGGGLFEDGGFEYASVLERRPRGNVLRFKVAAQGLRFFRQPDGSYAAYHATRAWNFRDRHYRAGKAFHVLRPWAEDAAGRRAWCELRMPLGGNGLAVIAVPQWFLDDAVYPVLVDPTMGYTSIGGTTAAFQSDLSDGCRCSLFATRLAGTDETVETYTAYGDSSAPGPTCNMAVYVINGSMVPTTRLAAVRTISLTSTPGWRSVSALSLALSSGTTYGAAAGGFVGGSAATINMRYDTGAGTLASNDVVHGAPPATWTQDSTTSRMYSWYATVDAPVAAVPRPLVAPNQAVQRAANW